MKAIVCASILAAQCIGCASVPPTQCKPPDGYAMISEEDVDKVNEMFSDLKQRLAACYKGRT